MKPFARRQLTTQKRVFNYRFSRARRQIECTFGILSNTWRIMKSIDTDVLPAIDSVKAICVLHNFLLAKELNRIQVASDSDKDNWLITGDTSARFTGSRNSTQQSATIRQTLCDYFNSPEGSLPRKSSDAGSILTLGGTNPDLYTGNFTFIPVTVPGFWGFWME
ncbi:hypothetical protein PoB_006628800, partial [Plakobranchus ocellatus]